MVTFLATFEDAGGLAWILLGVGALGVFVALVGLLALVLRARAARWLGVAAAVLGVLCAGMGGVGVLQARVATDHEASIEGSHPVERQRIRRDGYLLARAPARLGLVFAALPLLTGVALLFAATRRRTVVAEPDAEEAPAPRGRLALPIGVAALGLLSAGFAGAALEEPVPGRNLRADETTRRLLDQLDDVQRTTDTHVLLDACRALEDAITAGQATFDAAHFPTLPAAARRCVDERVQEAAVLRPISAVRDGMQVALRSPFVEHDAALRIQLEAQIEEVGRIARDEAETPPALPLANQVRTGAVEVTGAVPTAEVERVGRQNTGRFRLCYESALRYKPTLQGYVTVRFTIGRGGSVSAVKSGGSDVAEPRVVACVVQTFARLVFPAPAAGTAAVAYTIHFALPDADLAYQPVR